MRFSIIMLEVAIMFLAISAVFRERVDLVECRDPMVVVCRSSRLLIVPFYCGCIAVLWFFAVCIYRYIRGYSFIVPVGCSVLITIMCVSYLMCRAGSTYVIYSDESGKFDLVIARVLGMFERYSFEDLKFEISTEGCKIKNGDRLILDVNSNKKGYERFIEVVNNSYRVIEKRKSEEISRSSEE